MQDGTLIAAVDLGSNSFRVEIARYDQGQIQRVEYIKEAVRLGGGLDDERNLTPDAMQRGWDCLARFAERLAGFAPQQVRAVATQTLREARNRAQFIERGSAILGHAIEVISGPEEARLIYQGVAHLLPQSDERRLVIDIGGRSTELILGQQYQAQEVASFRVGSVSSSAQFFADGQFTPRAFLRAETAAQAVLDEALAVYLPQRWERAYGSSGTVGAVGDILAASGRGHAGVIRRQDLDWLQQQLLRAGHASRVDLPGLKDDRRPVIGGGVSVLRALMDLLRIDALHVAQGALRQGALYDLLDRESPHTDQRSATVTALAQRFAVDGAQARRVAQVAGRLFAQAAPQGCEQAAHELAWAAELHEIGQRIAHSGYHRHGAYILEYTDAPGFAQHELQQLGVLLRGHRGKLRKLELDWNRPLFALQLACLRLAVALCHARRDPDIDGLRLQQHGERLILQLPADWAARYPQSAHLLREESLDWQRTPWAMEVVE